MGNPLPKPKPSAPATAASRRKRADAGDEAQLSLVRPIANWQARLAWACASWGLIPILGLPLGLMGVVFGLLGWRRVHQHPDDLGLRHAVGGLLVGGFELLCNGAATFCIIRGLLELRH